MNKESLNIKDYLLLVVILIVFIAISLVYELNQNFSFDQTQMLLKGFHASVNNEYLPFGNEASTMGNVPGMLSSWLIGFPLEFYIGIESIIVFQILLRLLAILIFANALSLIFPRSIVMLGTFLFALSPWYLYHTMIYNPAYIHFGAAISLNCLIRLRYDKSQKGFSLGRVFSSIFLVLSIGFVLQLHYSWVLIAAVCFIMWLRRDIKISYLGVLIGLGLIGISLIPYIQEIMVNKSLLNNPEPYAQDRYIGYGLTHVYPIFKAILYWLRFGSLFITSKAILINTHGEELSTLWLILSYAWSVIAYLIGAATLVFCAYANYFAIYKFRSGNSSDKFRFIRGLTISSILAVIIISAASTIVLNFWQMSLVLPLALIPVLSLIAVRQKYARLYFIVAALFFALANPIAAMLSDNFSYKNNFYVGVYQSCLSGFDKDQCAPYSKALNEETRQQVESNYPYPDQKTIDRVIKGLIPSYINTNEHKEDSNSPISYNNNDKKQSEQALAKDTKMDGNTKVELKDESSALLKPLNLNSINKDKQKIATDSNGRQGTIIIDDTSSSNNALSGELIIQ